MKLACQIVILILFMMQFCKLLSDLPNTMGGAIFALSLWFFVAFLYWHSGTFSEILALLQ